MLDRIVHLLIGFTDREAADGESVIVQSAQLCRRFGAEGFVGAALDDGKDVLVGADPFLLFFAEVSDRLFGPLRCAFDREFDTLLRSRKCHKVVEYHHDVRAEVVLDVDHLLGGKIVSGAVDMASELYAVGIGFGDVAETEGLEPAAVGQEAFGVGGEVVQFAHLADRLVSRAEVHMVGVGQNDLGA